MSELVITAEMPMEEIEGKLPGARRALFQKYHVGGCSSCGFQPTDTLKEVCASHNLLDVDEVIQWLGDSHELDQKMQISPEEVKAELGNGNGFKLLDVRSPDELEIARIDGATPLDQQNSQEIMDGTPKETPLVFMCHHGIASMDAAAYFIGHGFTNVKSMTGGIDAWSQQIDPAIPRY